MRPALAALGQTFAQCDWTREGIAATFKPVLAAHGLKMPQLAIPVRLLVFGLAQTPSVDACLALMPREVVVRRLSSAPAN
jgi:glutamyl-tRNA synthetase